MSDSPFLGATSGLSRQRLRARVFRRETRGVYVLAEHAPSLLLRVRALQVALPDAVASHGTAAVLQRLPVPRPRSVHLTRPRRAPVSERPQLVTHRSHLRAEDVSEHLGVRVTLPVRTFLDLAPHLAPDDLVVLGDAVARRSGLPALQHAVDEARGRRGVVAARRALEEVDPGAESPAETRCRLVLHRAGLRHLVHGVEVRDRHGGWLATPDLADRHARVAVQYDGLVHFEEGEERWRADIDRDELVRAEDWQVVVLTARDLRRPERMLHKVLEAYRRAGTDPCR